jgi:hypothetical protein
VRLCAVGFLIVALFSGAIACGGGTFFVSATEEGVSFFAVSGSVSVVQLTVINGGQVTVVTLLNTGAAAQTFTFCGNVVAQFPTNTFVTVTYQSSVGCNTVIQVR